jgi:pimeloyl-ACP methyl ester carboxylesterase
LRFGSGRRQAGGAAADGHGRPPAKAGGLSKLAPAAAMSSSTLSSSSASSDSDSDSSCWDDLPPVEKTVHNVVTSDGVTLVLVRALCPAARSGSATRREHPILMIPGLASAADTTFDLTPEYSLFDHLAREGYDVWRADLRGNGRSGCPDSSITQPGWNVDDHLFRDLPAVMAYVLEETGAQQVHWVGAYIRICAASIALHYAACVLPAFV